MQANPNHNQHPLSAENKPHPLCPGCKAPVQPGGGGFGRKFCTKECLKKFRNRSSVEGRTLVPLVKAWHSTRHARPGSREAEICKFARGQIAEIARIFLERDLEDGRDSVAYVGSLMDSGMLYIDRTQR